MARPMAGRGGFVHAFEPQPEAARRAAATFALNGVTNIRLYPCALGDIDGDVSLFYAAGQSATASCHLTSHLRRHRRLTSIVVPCRTVDAMVRGGEIGPIGLMKIDVEGHEMNVLCGAQQTLRSAKPEILYENNPHTLSSAQWNPSSMEALLAGYRFEALRPDGATVTLPTQGNRADSLDVCAFPLSVQDPLE